MLDHQVFNLQILAKKYPVRKKDMPYLLRKVQSYCKKNDIIRVYIPQLPMGENAQEVLTHPQILHVLDQTAKETFRQIPTRRFFHLNQQARSNSVCEKVFTAYFTMIALSSLVEQQPFPTYYQFYRANVFHCSQRLLSNQAQIINPCTIEDYIIGRLNPQFVANPTRIIHLLSRQTNDTMLQYMVQNRFN